VGKGYLIDSNVIIDFFNKSLPDRGRDLLFNIEPIISIITLIEIFSGNKASPHEIKELKDFCEIATIHNVDRDVALIAIDIRIKNKIKLPDALIAATAIFYNLVLITRNISDFKTIEGLEIINPHTI
jgi:predicted nucleic acid-binding protein